MGWINEHNEEIEEAVGKMLAGFVETTPDWEGYTSINGIYYFESELKQKVREYREGQREQAPLRKRQPVGEKAGCYDI